MAGFINYFSGIINSLGYIGIFLAAALEYACFPISSEILLPFIGYSVYLGKLSLFKAIISSTIGGGVGCSFCYFLGRFGRGIIEKLFKKNGAVYLGIEKAERYFDKMGNESVFYGRLMPIVRTYISFPAGMAKMGFPRFFMFSVMGAMLWNTALVSVGFALGEHWESVSVFFSENKNLILILVFIFVGIFLCFRRKKC